MSFFRTRKPTFLSTFLKSARLTTHIWVWTNTWGLFWILNTSKQKWTTVNSFSKFWEYLSNAANFLEFLGKWSNCYWPSEAAISKKNQKTKSMNSSSVTCPAFMSWLRSTGLRTSWHKASKVSLCTYSINAFSIHRTSLSGGSNRSSWENLDSSFWKWSTFKPKTTMNSISYSSPWWPKAHGGNSTIGKLSLSSSSTKASLDLKILLPHVTSTLCSSSFFT